MKILDEDEVCYPASQVPLVAASQGMYDLTQHPPDVPWILHVDSCGFMVSLGPNFIPQVGRVTSPKRSQFQSSQKGHQQNCQDDDIKIWLL